MSAPTQHDSSKKNCFISSVQSGQQSKMLQLLTIFHNRLHLISGTNSRKQGQHMIYSDFVSLKRSSLASNMQSFKNPKNTAEKLFMNSDSLYLQQSAIKSHGLYCKKDRKVPKPTKQHKRNGAKDYRGFTVDDWA